MKTIIVLCEWKSTHEIDVPDEWDAFEDDLPESAFDAMDPHTAELMDYEVIG